MAHLFTHVRDTITALVNDTPDSIDIGRELVEASRDELVTVVDALTGALAAWINDTDTHAAWAAYDDFYAAYEPAMNTDFYETAQERN